METNNNSNNAQSENGGAKTNQTEQNKEAKLTTNFLEFGEPKKVDENNLEHTLAITTAVGEKRGKVTAKINIAYEGEPKKAVFTAKDLEGNVLFPPTQKLWELKKTIKEHAAPLLEKANQFKHAIYKADKTIEESIVVNEAKEIGATALDETHGFVHSAKDIVHGTDTKRTELVNIRNRKVEKDKGLSR